MPYVLADSGPLVAAFDLHDQYHARSQDELSRISNQRLESAIVISTILEAYSLVRRRFDTRLAVRWLGGVISSANVMIYPEIDDYNLALNVIGRYPDQDLTLFDTVLYVVSERLQIPIWTYDHHFDILRANRWHPS